MSFSKQLFPRNRAHSATENSLRTQNENALVTTQMKPPENAIQATTTKQATAHLTATVPKRSCEDPTPPGKRTNKRPTTPLKSRGGGCPPSAKTPPSRTGPQQPICFSLQYPMYFYVFIHKTIVQKK
ncbi:unnamed protein product [Ectocarpus sp. 13 AM-2016]